MSYGLLFLSISASLVLVGVFPQATIGKMGLSGGYWFPVLTFYPAFAYALMGIAYLRGRAQLLGKNAAGRVHPLAEVVLFPYLIFYRVTWKLVRQKSGEAPYNNIGAGVWVGRRLLNHEHLDGELSCIVDFTCEFSEPNMLASREDYRTFPTLDGTPVANRDLDAALRHVAPFEQCYIHCAEGHGRAGMMGCLLLLERGAASTVDEAVKMATAERAGIHLRPAQRAQLERYWAKRKANTSASSAD